ncbi:MAG: autotransporter domain-containing protein [Thermoguttaceae bacterium]|nr:autotransporter domain-containing protein [Thermoguttaceae bacterium]
MTLFPLRQLWRLLASIVAAAPLALVPAFALGDNIPSDGLTLSSNPGSVTYTFVGGSSPSGPVKIDLSGTSVLSELPISAAFVVNNDASIFTTNGSGKTTKLNGTGITITSGNELTFGSPSESTDLGTINVNAAISGGQALNINRGSQNAETALNVANSDFSGAVNIVRGVLTINAVDAINANNAVVISENGTLKMGSASSATVQTITNNGTILLNNKTLVISESGSTLGKIANGLLQFNSDFTLDNSAELNDVDLVLNGTTMTVATDSDLASVQTTSGKTGTVVINDGKTLTLTNPNAFGTGVTYKSNKNNDGTLIFGSEDGVLSGNFATGSTAQLSTSDGSMVIVQVNKKSSWTLGTDETVNGLALAGGSNSSTASTVNLGNNTLNVNAGIESYGVANVSTSGSGSVKLINASNFVGDGTLTIDNVNLNNKTLSIQAGSESTSTNPYTVKFKKVSNPGNIAINRNTVLEADLATSAALYGYNGGTLDGNLTQTGTGKTYIKDGTFNVTGDAKFTSGNGIVMDMIEGTKSSGIPGLNVGGKLIFNTDATSAIKSDDADMTVLTLSGYRSGEGLKITLEAEDGIYGYGNGNGSELNNVAKKVAPLVGGTEYIVYDSGTNENYFKILLDNTAAFDVDSLTYNDGLLNINLKARTTTHNPIEQVIVNGVNDGNEAMTSLYNKINATSDRNAAINQLNPYTVSATTANQLWISQEYMSRTFQRMKMIRAAACGFDTFVPMGPGYADIDSPEVAYLAQSYGYPEYDYGYGYGYGYGAPCGWRPGYCGVLGNQWWFRGIGAWERQEAEGNLAQYDTDYSGFTIGVDRLYGPGMLFGMSAGGVWNTTKFKDAGGSIAKGGTFLIDLYGSYFNNCSHFDYMFGYQGGTTDTTRRTDFGVAPTGGQIKSNTFIAAMELGRTFRFLRNTLEPYYDLQYVNLQNDGFTEFGSEAALDVYKNNQHALLQTIGIRYMGSCAGPLKGYYFIPQVEVGWVHNYSNTDIVSVASFANAVEAGSFVTTGYHVPRDRVKVSVGLDIVFNPAAKIDIKYECQAGDGFGFHTLTGGFDWNF